MTIRLKCVLLAEAQSGERKMRIKNDIALFRARSRSRSRSKERRHGGDRRDRDRRGGGDRDRPRGRDRSRDRGGRAGPNAAVNPRRCYIANIPYELRWQDIKDLFREKGMRLMFIMLWHSYILY